MEEISTITKLVRFLRIKLSQPRIFLGIILLFPLTYLIIVPIFSLIAGASSFQLVDTFRLPGVEVGEVTLYHWVKVFSNSVIFAQPLLNTLLVGIGVAVVTMFLGCMMAWLVSRTDMPLKVLISILATLPYILPSWALALPWIEIFRNTGIGMGVGFLEYATGLKAPPWLVFGYLPVVIVLGLHYFPFVFIMVSIALKNVSSELEEAGELLNAGRLRIFRTITFPIVMPALLSAALLAFSRAIGSFGTLSLLGIPGGLTVLSIQIKSLMDMNRQSESYILAIILVTLAAVVFYLNSRVIGTRKSFETIGGKGIRKHLVPLGKLRTLIPTAVITFLLVAVVFPLGLLVWTSFMSSAGDYSLSNFSLEYWIGVADPADPEYITGYPGVFRHPMFFVALKNTIFISVVGAVITASIGMLVGYVVIKGRGKRLSRLIEQVSFIPILIPSIAFGATYISLFGVSRGLIPALYGTLAIMVLVVIGKQMPYASRTGISVMYQPSKELEEAAEIVGAGWLKRFKQIIWPLTMHGFSAGLLIVFITTTRELSLFIMLVTAKTAILTTLTFAYAEMGVKQLSYALMTTLVVLTLSFTGMYKLYERYSTKSLKEKGIL